MSKYTLFDEYPLIVDRKLAQAIGLNEAIVVQQINYWLYQNRKADRNFHDGRYWTYNSYPKWQEENFPFWSVSTIKRTFRKLEKKGILKVGNYNKMKIDRTKWYSIDRARLDEVFKEEFPNSSDCPDGEVKSTPPLPETSTETSKEVKGTPQGRSTQNDSVRVKRYSHPRECMNVSNKFDEVIQYYLDRHGEHPKLREEVWDDIVSAMDRYPFNNFEVEHWWEVIEKHFTTKYEEGCDYHLPHFANFDILKNRSFECGLISGVEVGEVEQ